MINRQLEPMTEFFTKRVNGYDEHMLADVAGCKQGYRELAARLPDGMETLLDLGVGTGLELTEIYRRFPNARVTGVDLCGPMLAECRRKHAQRHPTLICGDYLMQDYGERAFDVAVSFETLHHLDAEEKRTLFKRVYRALRPSGRYVQGDYAARDAQEEAALFAQLQTLRLSQGVAEGERVHFDTPLTAEHECALLREAGFATAEAVWKEDNTVLIVACKA